MFNVILKKKLFLLLLIFIFITFAEISAEESEYYFKTVRIEKVYPTRLGYRILYMKNDLSFTVFYVPMRWIQEAGGKGEVVLTDKASAPYFSIFWKGGVFDHIRLYLPKNSSHPSWGVIDASLDLTEKFNVETLDLEF